MLNEVKISGKTCSEGNANSYTLLHFAAENSWVVANWKSARFHMSDSTVFNRGRALPRSVV